MDSGGGFSEGIIHIKVCCVLIKGSGSEDEEKYICIFLKYVIKKFLEVLTEKT